MSTFDRWAFVALSLLALAILIALGGCSRPLNFSTGPTPGAPAPVVQWFTADATRLGPPNGATLDTYLRWDVLGAGVACRIDPNVGNVPTSGFLQVRPVTSRDYMLSCTNAGGSVVRVVSIIVN